jgi:leucyl-tRNA synthetase
MDGSTGPADPAVREAAEVITVALSLVAPYVAEEMWERLGHAPSVAKATWPTVESSLLVTQSVTCVVQVQGKVRGRLQVPPGISEESYAPEP